MGLMQPVEPFFYGTEFIPAGRVYRDDDPLVRKFPSMFRPAEPVETATAAPGEVRAVARPVKKAAKRAASEDD